MPQLPAPLPLAHYFRCIDAENQPVGYVGDWPTAGQIYVGYVKPAVNTGTPHVHLDGFWAAAPWGAFAISRFEHFTTVHLN